MTIHKIKAGRVPGAIADDFIGDLGTLFYSEELGDLRIGDGVTPGGVPISAGGGGGGYTLPTASTTVKGGVKVDGTTITIASQIISVGSITYDKISNPPTIPTNTNQLTNGAGYITSSSLSGYATETYVTTRGYLTSVSWNDVTSKPSFATVATTGSYNDLINKPTLFSGSYNDLTNKPTLVTSYNQLTDLPSLFSGSYNDLTNKPTLFSGSYTDLTNKPTIPTDISQLTDTQGLLGQGGGGGGTTVITNNIENSYTFSVAGDDSTLREISNGETLRFQGATGITITSDTEGKITITGPDLTGYATETYVTTRGYLTTVDWSIITNKPSLFSGSYNDLTDKPTLFSGSYTDLTNKPTIPTNTNELTNGAGFITSSALTGYATETYVTTRGYLTSVSWYDLTDKPNLAGTYSWNIAADDSTQIEVASGNLVKIVGSRGVTTTSNPDGQITITGPDLSNYATQSYVNAALSSSGVTVSPTVPTGLLNGALWYNSSELELYVLYEGQWVSTSASFSGDYNDLTNKPTNVSQFNNDAGYTTRDEVYAMILEMGQ
jgi:hypothetical protein